MRTPLAMAPNMNWPIAFRSSGGVIVHAYPAHDAVLSS